jgi:chromosome segregation ATPase
MQNELLTNEIANISDKCTGLQAEIDRLNREKAKFERDAQTAQESVGIMEAQKSKFETMLKASEGIISSRDQLIQGLEARLAGLENQTADGNRVRELDMKLREKQALAGQLQKELDLARSDLAMLRQSADQMGRLSQSK